MSNITALTRFASVRRGFTEESIWRDALGGPEPLRVHVIDGPLDAPEYMPCGSMQFNVIGKQAFAYAPVVQRGGAIA